MAIIVRLFCQLILLSCVFVQYSSTLNDTDYILCTARCSPLTGSLTDPAAVLSDCQDNGSEDGSGIFDYALTCGITYTLDYNRQSIHVQFTASNATSDDEEARPQASLVQKVHWNLDEHAPGPKELSRTYSCSVKKDCAREFFLQSIAALANDGREKLDAIKEKLYFAAAIVGEGARRRCIDDRKTGNKTSVKCGYGLCYGRFETYELDAEKNSKLQRCERPQRSYLLSEVERHTPKSPRDKQVLELVCNKNVCNRNDLLPKIEALLHAYTQWTPDARDENAPAASPASVAEKSAPGAASHPQTLASSLVLSLVVLLQLFL